MIDSLVFLTGKMVVSVFARLQSSACSVNSLQKKGKNIVTSMLNNISFFMLNDTRVCSTQSACFYFSHDNTGFNIPDRTLGMGIPKKDQNWPFLLY